MATPVSLAPKVVDYATDRFNLLSMEKSSKDDCKPSADDNAWVGFQSVEIISTYGENVQSKPVETKNQFNFGIEELFKDLQWVTHPTSDKLAKDVKNYTMNLFEKSSMVSLCYVH